MALNRVVDRSDEPVEFRPVPGQEDEWASLSYVERSALWGGLGALPVGVVLVVLLVLMGLGLS
jgi:hypothetical protein